MTSGSCISPANLLLPERLLAHHSLIGNRQREIGMNEDDYNDEMAQIQREITEECMEYGENMQRSEDEGWFYPDGDDAEVTPYS